MKVEWLILADAAQVVGNKLYLMGGGWDVLTVNSGFPVQRHFAIAASFRVPWNETNQRHDFEIEIATEDGETVGKMQGHFEVGRPPGIRLGQDQRTQIAAEMDLRLKSAGTYVIMARVQGHEEERVAFNVVEGSGMVRGQDKPPEREQA